MKGRLGRTGGACLRSDRRSQPCPSHRYSSQRALSSTTGEIYSPPRNAAVSWLQLAIRAMVTGPIARRVGAEPTLTLGRADMPLGYLLPTLMVAWCTLCAVGPRRWPLGSGQVRFRSSMVINELPCLGLYWLLVTTLSTVAQGELASPVGWLAFVINCVTVLGLSVIVLRQRRAGPAMAAALDSGLGPRSRASHANDSRPRVSRWQSARLLLVPSRARQRKIERIPDISYGDAGAANTLDLYRSRSGTTGRPVLIHLHGGALHRGRKNREGLPLIYGMAGRGWVCISANYRLSPAATFPAHLVDVKKVVAWVRAHGESYGADPNRIFVAGGSAGAQLAALTALTANETKYQPGFESIDTAVSGAITLYGVYGRRSASGIDARADDLPARHVTANAPSFLVVHGDADSVLSVDGARDFAADLRRASANPVVYAEVPGAQHSFDMYRSLRAAHLLNTVQRFTDRILREQSLPHPPQPRRY